MNELSAAQTGAVLVRGLLARGVTDAVLSPGSRSAPIALALHAADAAGRIRLHVRVDEREAGFVALGLAKTSGRTVPVVTTSGTAVANLHPALLEALHAQVAVLAVTADRPARLRGTGANQTTVQPGIFPGIAAVSLENLSTLAPTAPAHLNLELDEPLVAPPAPLPAECEVGGPPHADLARKRHTQRAGGATVVLAGDGAGVQAREVAEAGGWPLLAEPTSGARFGAALPAYRLLLDHGPLTERIERVISFGHPTLSRPVTRLLARTDLDIVHVGRQATFPTPAGARVTFVDDVRIEPGDHDAGWLAWWQRADAAAQAAVERARSASPGSGLDVARAVVDAVPAGGLLVVGASQPVRDLDLVAPAWPADLPRHVLANRGLAGIDGTLSTAIGATLAVDATRSLALVGDLTFLHGSNGLLIGPDEPRPDLTIVVANDDGGAIFSTLEQGGPDYAEPFERVFGTPTGADLGALCAGYRVPHRRVAPHELPAALAPAAGGLEVVEVTLARADRRALDSAVRAEVSAALDSVAEL